MRGRARYTPPDQALPDHGDAEFIRQRDGGDQLVHNRPSLCLRRRVADGMRGAVDGPSGTWVLASRQCFALCGLCRTNNPQAKTYRGGVLRDER